MKYLRTLPVRWLAGLAVVLFAGGCSTSTPEESDVVFEPMSPRVQEEIEAQVRRLDPYRATLYVEGVSLQDQDTISKLRTVLREALRLELQGLELSGSSPEILITEHTQYPGLGTGSSAENEMTSVKIAPVADLQKFLQNLKFGKVVAADINERRALVDPEASSESQEPWGNKAELDRRLNLYLARKLYEHIGTQTMGADLRRLTDQYGADQVVAVLISQSGSLQQAQKAAERLAELVATPEQPVEAIAGDQTTYFDADAVLAPVADVQELARKIPTDFATVELVASEGRALFIRLLEPLPQAPPPGGPPPNLNARLQPDVPATRQNF